MQRLNTYKRELCFICRHGKTKKEREEHFLQCNKEVIKAIVDIINNVLKGKIKIQNRHKLAKYKQHLRYLVNRRISLANKRQCIIQKGGFLPFLAPLIPLLIKAAAFAAPIIAKGALAGAAGTAAAAAANKIISST